MSTDLKHLPGQHVQASHGGGSGGKADTDTPEFKAWFGDSKVTKANGEPQEEYGPKPIFHGTGQSFEEFKPSKQYAGHVGKGIYFAENREIADNFAKITGSGEVIEAYMSVKNPLDFDKNIDIDKAKSWLPDLDARSDRYKKLLDYEATKPGGLTGKKAWESLARYVDAEYVNEHVQKAGYDGITHTSYDNYGSVAGRRPRSNFGKVWIAFEPTQIKATSNTGSWNPEDPNMFKHTKGNTTAEEYLDKFDLDIEDIVFDTPYGEVSMGFATDYPEWMKTKIADMLEETFDQPFWEDVNLTTLGDITKYLKEGIRRGESIETMAKKMAPDLVEEGHYATVRGRRIARTESGHALNAARTASIDHLKADVGDDVPLKKAWLSVLGTTTRLTHADLDGVPENEDGVWIIGGQKARWPSDVHLTANERINCQCSVVVEFGMGDDEADVLIDEYSQRLVEEAEAEKKKLFAGTDLATEMTLED